MKYNVKITLGDETLVDETVTCTEITEDYITIFKKVNGCKMELTRKD